MKTISSHQLEVNLSDLKYREFFSYGKQRVSGKQPNSYIMHSRSACMPGQKGVFVFDSKTNPEDKTEANMLMLRTIYKREQYLLSNEVIGNKFPHNVKDLFTYKAFHPYDDESLEIAISSAYKQVYGNLMPMENERSIEAQRRLRNGDITIREFIRLISNSEFYRYHFFEKVSQKKCIELNFMHILGRPLINKNELKSNITLIHNYGLKAQIDSLINSIEYEEFFGEDIVPYQRFWNSPCGSSPESFLSTASYGKGFPSSDNVNYK